LGGRSVRRIPLAVKLVFTAFMAILVPFYWVSYGPTNFLYFCDMALFLALAAVWTELPLLAGMPAVGILVPQMLWVADFIAACFGGQITGMTGYMFRDSIPLFTRALSLFHGWLPFFLLYLVWRLGYDRRSLPAWTVLAFALIFIAYFLLPPPPAAIKAERTLPTTVALAGDPNNAWLAAWTANRTGNPDVPVNVDYVYGLDDNAPPQTWMPPLAWLALLLVGLPVLFFLPAHLILCLFPRPSRNSLAFWRVPR
jgi:hypothetical protein